MGQDGGKGVSYKAEHGLSMFPEASDRAWTGLKLKLKRIVKRVELRDRSTSVVA
jgi:hypothetical protein